MNRRIRMVRMALSLFATVLLASCASRAPQASGVTADARVRNAIADGIVSSVFFGVQSVDGVAVHKKFDRDREVRLTPGAHELMLRYYAQGLQTAPEGESECKVALRARAGADYRVEGVARDGRWRARLIDDRAAESVDCTFADGTTWGAVRDASDGETAVRAEPLDNGERAAPVAAAAAPAAAPVASAAAAPAAAPVVGAPVGATAGASAVDLATAPNEPASGPPAANSELLAGVRKIIKGQMDVDWGCSAGYLRARGWSADGTLVLKGSERVRLLGIEPAGATKLDLDGACVRLAFDDGAKLAGERDREGRLFAYVFLPDGSFVNEEMLRAGEARVETRAHHRYLGAFLAAQSEARDAGRGIWAIPPPY